MSNDEAKLVADLARIQRMLGSQFYIKSLTGAGFLWSKYRMSRQDVAMLLVSQLGYCACCGIDLDGVKWAIDHLHGTYQIRGIVCYSCNVGIGQLGDSIQGLMKAVEYLKRFEEKRKK